MVLSSLMPSFLMSALSLLVLRPVFSLSVLMVSSPMASASDLMRRLYFPCVLYLSSSASLSGGRFLKCPLKFGCTRS